MSGGAVWRHPWVRHLRLAFNLTLSPIFLWGVYLAGGTLQEPRVWVAFVALQLFLYGGTTAFNSYFDRDQGPIGGLRHPPPVDRGLLWWSLAVQGAGVPLALWVGAPFTLAYLALFALAAAYSHPVTRLKARLVPALLAVTLGQGGVGFLAGWWAASARDAGWAALAEAAQPIAAVGAAAAALMLSGLYVVTQAYQTEEDARRGDRTLAVVLGPRRALCWGLCGSTLGLGLLAALVLPRAGATWSLVLVLGGALLGSSWWRWAVRFDEAALDANYAAAMRVAGTAGAALSLFLLLQLARV